MPRDEKLRSKLRVLASAARYDASCASSGSKRARTKDGLGNSDGVGICHSYTPDGRCVSLLKILLTNYCIYDCLFCVNRVSSDTERARFTPEEVAWITIEFYKRNYIEGLFLSSGIIQNSDYTMEELLRTAKLLREQYNFSGYIHLKAIPGASPELLQLAGRYADRLSANIELPREADLQQIAKAKSHAVIESTMSSIKAKIAARRDEAKRIRSTPKFVPAGQSTQMIVGATPANDTSILQKASQLYCEFGLRRVYYSAFSPAPSSDPLLPAKPAPLIREHRLYQADWLLRNYGFSIGELTFANGGNLDLELDPKTSWALAHREFFPLDVNKASREALLRVPGLGHRSVDRILKARRVRALRTDDLKRLRISLEKVKHFLVTADFNPHSIRYDRYDLRSVLKPRATQLSLFDSPASVITGEL